MHPLAEKYLRKSSLPSIFCPGCGDGIILNAMIQVMETMGRENFLFVSGIGCSGWIPVFIETDVIHSLHGRALPIATGLKMVQPGKKVVVFTGDGDCLGIGGGHFIHAARRNVDITVVMINNYIYGMTGGQAAPTTPHDVTTKTTPYGNPETPFDASKLAIAAGASFVSRQTTSYPHLLAKDLEAAVRHEGFSFLEVMTPCPTQGGRNIFGSGDPSFLFNEHKKRAVMKKEAPLEENQYHVGILHQDLSRTPYGVKGNGGESNG